MVHLEAARKITDFNILQAQQKQKRNADKDVSFSHFDIGDLVYLRIEAIKQGRKAKLAQKWKGPYRVISNQGNGVYQIASIFNSTGQQSVNIQRLKKFQYFGDIESTIPESTEL